MFLQGKAKVENGKVTGVLGGCLPPNEICDSEKVEGNSCPNANEVKECQKCCKAGDVCNNWLDDPEPWSTAPINVASILLMCISALLTYNF